MVGIGLQSDEARERAESKGAAFRPPSRIIHFLKLSRSTHQNGFGGKQLYHTIATLGVGPAALHWSRFHRPPTATTNNDNFVAGKHIFDNSSR